MPFLIRIYYKDSLYSADISTTNTCTIGSGSNDTIQINDSKLKPRQITIFNKAGEVLIEGKHLYEKNDNSFDLVKSSYLDDGKIYGVLAAEKIFIIISKLKSNETFFDLKKVGSDCSIFIGRSKENQIMLINDSISHKHCSVYMRDSNYFVEDLGSTNGTYLNGKRITEPTKINIDDVINVASYNLILKDEKLYITNFDRDLKINLSNC